MNKFKILKKTIFGALLVSACFFTINAFAVEVVPVSGCRYSGVEGDVCIASDGTSTFQITNCVNSNTVTSCGISVPTPVIAD